MMSARCKSRSSTITSPNAAAPSASCCHSPEPSRARRSTSCAVRPGGDVPRVCGRRCADAADQPACAPSPVSPASPCRSSPRPSRGSPSKPMWSSAARAAGRTARKVVGRKIVYCHTPARWLYQSDRYLRGRARPTVFVQSVASLSRCAAAGLGPARGRLGRRLPRQLDGGCRTDQGGVRHRGESRCSPACPHARRSVRSDRRHRAGLRPVRVEAPALQERRCSDTSVRRTAGGSTRDRGWRAGRAGSPRSSRARNVTIRQAGSTATAAVGLALRNREVLVATCRTRTSRSAPLGRRVRLRQCRRRRFAGAASSSTSSRRR